MIGIIFMSFFYAILLLILHILTSILFKLSLTFLLIFYLPPPLHHSPPFHLRHRYLLQSSITNATSPQWFLREVGVKILNVKVLNSDRSCNSYCGITITILNHVKSYQKGFYLRPPLNRHFRLKACSSIRHVSCSTLTQY